MPPTDWIWTILGEVSGGELVCRDDDDDDDDDADADADDDDDDDDAVCICYHLYIWCCHITILRKLKVPVPTNLRNPSKKMFFSYIGSMYGILT